MHRKGFPRALVILAVLHAAIADPTLAQEPLRLRFAPPGYSPVAVVFQTHTRAVGSNGQAYEFADLGLMTELALEVQEGVQVLHITYDSLLVRAREGNGVWREFALPPNDSLWMQLRLDDRGNLIGTNGRRLPSLTDPVALVTGLRGMVLPEQALRVGERWEARVAIALPRSPSDAGARLLDALLTDAVLTLDSIVTRANDTLGYVTATAQVERTTVVDPYGREPARWVFAGELTASLIWSTGWNVFVAGMNRYLVRARRPASPGGTEAATLEWETTTRYQVRP
jgi:hypothetical protein